MLGEAKTEWTLFVDGCGKDGKRIYDQVRGKTCHQCRYITVVSIILIIISYIVLCSTKDGLHYLNILQAENDGSSHALHPMQHGSRAILWRLFVYEVHPVHTLFWYLLCTDP